MSVKGFKNRRRSVCAAVFIGFALQACLATAQNLITNPGFESGSISPWAAFGGSITLSVETTQVHSGTYAAEVSGRSQTYEGISQQVLSSLTAGQTYNVSAWVRLVSGANQNVQMTVQKIDGSGTTYTAITSNSVSSTAWTQLSGQYAYNPSGSASSVIFYVEVPSSSSASYYIDDVSWTNGPIVSNPPISAVSTVNWNTVYQRIDGFGASSAWNGSWTTAEADLLFSTNSVNYPTSTGPTYNGAGLSLLRNHIAYASTSSSNDLPTTVETSIMQMAQARGARVWSTPWTPAAGFKSANDIYDSGVATASGIDGGSYLGYGNNITNLNYASQLANYVASMKNTYGVNLYAISMQNEPDADVTSYEACQWTNTQFHDFATNLYNALAAQGLGSTKIIVPESENWTDPKGLASAVMSDPATAADIGIIADHDYVADNSVGDQTVPAAVPSYGKALWETEVALLSGSDSSINNGVYFAQRVHLFMTQAQANAYHYWWLVASGNGNEGLLDTSAAVTKRLFTIGQFSRFVRPNFYRIDATSSQPSALISAYKDSTSPAFAIVAINTIAATNIIETITLTNFSAATVTPWITSASLSLAPQTPVNVTNGTFTYTLPEMSVVTFVGQEAIAPPTIGPVANQTVNPDVTLLVTNSASASDVPPQTLAFAAANVFPSGAAINSSTGVFSWRPFVSYANTTIVIQIKVTDSGTGLSATNSFDVVVNPISAPVVSSISTNGGQIHLVVNGPSGPDYTLLTSTNMVNWQTELTVSSPTPPVTLVDTNYPNGPVRFYRVEIGP